MDKKRFTVLFSILFLSTFLVTAVLVSKTTNKWEPADRILSSQGNLQDLASSDLFRVSKNSILDSTKPSTGHNLGEIWVSVNGNEMNFAEAIQNTNLCGISNPSTTYSNPPDPSHLGTEVEITAPYDNQIKSLQDAINDGTLVGIDGGWSSWSLWSSCSADCGNNGIQTRSRTCNNPAPFCGGNNCVGPVTDSQACNRFVCPVDTYGNWVVQSHDFVSGTKPKCEGSFPDCCAPAVYTAGARDRCDGNTNDQYICASSAHHGACDDMDFRSSCIVSGGKIQRVSWWYRTVSCSRYD